jgi:hypothetical protein
MQATCNRRKTYLRRRLVDYNECPAQLAFGEMIFFSY